MTFVPRWPWFAFIVRRFVGPLPTGVVFTYGSTVYVPNGNLSLSLDLIEHEHTHSKQQGHFPWVWWLRWLLSPRFRYRQELAAYRVQLQTLREQHIPAALLVHHMARCLSGAMYGHLCTFDEALDAIWGAR